MRNMFDSRLWTFFVSLALSVLIWLFVRGELEIKEVIRVDLIYQKNQQVVALSPKPKSLRVEVRGPSALVSRIAQKVHRLEIVYANETVGRMTRSNLESDLRRDFPNEVEIVRMDPRELIVDLDEYATKTLALEVDMQGNLPEGFEVESVKISPEKLNFGGAKSLLAQRESFSVGAIDLSNAKGDLQKEFSLSPITTDGDVWAVRQETIKVQVKIREKTIVRELRIAVDFQAEGLQAQINPSSILLKVEGRFTLVNALTENDFKAYVEADGLKPGLYRRAVALRIPDAIGLLESQPRIFSIRIW